MTAQPFTSMVAHYDMRTVDSLVAYRQLIDEVVVLSSSAVARIPEQLGASL